MIGRAIASLRVERGLTRHGLVHAAGISYPYLAEIEKGTKQPSSAMLAKLAAALQVRPSELLARAECIAADPRNGIVAAQAALL